MVAFPFFYALQRQRVIGILLTFSVNIDAYQRQNHLFEVDLIDCAQSFDEMGRRIDVRSLMPDVSEKLRKKSFSHQSGLLVVPIIGLALFIGKTGPTRDARCEFVSQIGKIFLAENFLDLSEG